MSDEQDYKPKFKSSSEVLLSLFENGKSPISESFIRWKIWARWRDLVGPSMAENTEPVGLKDGTLYLWVKNSTWMQQLLFMKDQLRVTLNKKLEKEVIQQVKFTLDRREVPKQDNKEFQNSLSKIIKK